MTAANAAAVMADGSREACLQQPHGQFTVILLANIARSWSCRRS